MRNRLVLSGCLVLGFSAIALLPAAHHAAPRHQRAAATTTPIVTISAMGDTILGNTPSLPAHPRHYFDKVVRSMRRDVDVVFGNLEGTLTTQTHSKCAPSSSNCFAFRNPPSFARALADVGFTILSNGNNHSHDFGAAGLSETRQAISAAGMRHTGLPGEYAVQRAHGIRVAVAAFAPYSDTANMLDLSAAANLVRKAAAHADVVVVYMHAGAEGTAARHVTGNEEHYVGEDRGNPRRFAHKVIRAGADLVIGSGPHLMRGMEFYRHHLVAYSLGNFANFHNFNDSGILADSSILRVSLGPRGGFRTGRLVPVKLVNGGRPVHGGNSLAEVRSLSKQDFGVHAARLSRTGVIRPPA